MRDFTKGSIMKALFGLAVPIVLTNLLHTAYQLVDTFWVGRLGADAVASVSLSFPLIHQTAESVSLTKRPWLPMMIFSSPASRPALPASRPALVSRPALASRPASSPALRPVF